MLHVYTYILHDIDSTYVRTYVHIAAACTLLASKPARKLPILVKITITARRRRHRIKILFHIELSIDIPVHVPRGVLTCWLILSYNRFPDPRHLPCTTRIRGSCSYPVSHPWIIHNAPYCTYPTSYSSNITVNEPALHIHVYSACRKSETNCSKMTIYLFYTGISC